MSSRESFVGLLEAFMRVVLADVRGGSGFVSKDTVAGGYGSRLRPFSKVTRVVTWLKRHFHDLPSVQLASLAALATAGGHTVRYTEGRLVDGDLAKVGRRPTPASHQRLIIDHCRRLGIVTAAFYVFGFLDDSWESISATIQYAIDLGSTVAQFKLVTPYPSTPLWTQLAPLVTETDWERFDGFTPTFRHPALSADEMRFLLGAAYTRFYMRPSYLANYCRVEGRRVRQLATRLDARVSARQARHELAMMSRAVAC